MVTFELLIMYSQFLISFATLLFLIFHRDK